MNNPIIKINGLKEIDGMKFHDIEGGFGEGKKAMLVKEIANIHGRELKVINQAINMNRNRFNENIDIVDLKSVNQIDRDLLNNLGFSNSSIANANNIYLLSERGYAKLLKILEDDVAWEQYEKLVDGYFNMRAETKNKTKLVDNSLKEKEIEARLKNARAREANILLKICNNPNLSKEYVQVLQSKATEIIIGKAILPLPVVERKTYSATEIGKELGISANKVGILTNKHNLKTDKYGKLFHDKSRYSSKEVESFRYYDNVIPVLAEILSKA
ncbi:ORF6N domain-containing protein [Clostridium paraputrificum]|uniref:ORF6N domain-containing protein n=1 Tax=Clostridium paraputrificum TaxID=29363 RepID=UPI00232F8D37|nr:ORF6N domain-containing protein [Clostridium paraputrificum]MDB2104034.1 ORF6N domain-containing protein [Clostridium paraputrificum]